MSRRLETSRILFAMDVEPRLLLRLPGVILCVLTAMRNERISEEQVYAGLSGFESQRRLDAQSATLHQR